MHKNLALAAVAAFAISSAAAAEADTIFDVENARAVARSGGVVSDEQIEFLQRYGALSGTPGARLRCVAFYAAKRHLASSVAAQKTDLRS